MNTPRPLSLRFRSLRFRSLGSRCLGPRSALAVLRSACAVALVPAAALLAGCASTGSGDSVAARVTMRQFTGNQVSVELRSESHTDAVDYYSRPRADANVKIIPDGLMEALLRDLEQYDFERWANAGPGPKSGLGGVTKVIEVELDGAVRHVASHPQAEPAQINAVVQLAMFVSSAFSSVRGFQSVDEPERGAGIFSGPGLDG